MKENDKFREDDINVVDVLNVLWVRRNFIVKVGAIFLILGFIGAVTTPKEYEASCKLLPENNSKESSKLGGLGSLAGLAGLDFGSGSNGNLSTSLYPEIVESLPFLMSVLNDSIYFEEQEIYTTSFDYFENYVRYSLLDRILNYTFSLPAILKGVFIRKVADDKNSHGTSFYRPSPNEWRLIRDFSSRVQLQNDDETGLITIKVKMPDPLAAAQVASTVKTEVTNAVVKYNTNKSKDKLEFIQKSFDEARDEFERIALELARLTDENLNVSSARAKIELRKVQNEYDVAFDVYKGLASEVEQAKIKLKDDTPVFTVLQPIIVPIKSVNVSMLVMCIGSLILGIFVAVSLIGVKYVANAFSLE